MGVLNQGFNQFNSDGSQQLFSPQQLPGQFNQQQTQNFGGVPGVGGANPAANGNTAPMNAFGSPGWTPGFSAKAGYNPSQYADLNTTNQLAQALGGNALQTRMGPGDPFGVPPQNSISFGGDSALNAGLLAERYQKYDRATADAMTRAELAMQGPQQAPNADSNGGSLGSWSQWQGLPGGSQSLGSGANLGSSIPKVQPPTPAAMDSSAAAQNPVTPAATPAPTGGSSGSVGSNVSNGTTPGQGHSGGQQYQIPQFLQMLLGGGYGGSQGGYGGYSGGYGGSYGNYGGYTPPSIYQRPQVYTGSGGRGQFNNFMTGNGYQQQGNIWARPGSMQSPQPQGMQGFANMMNQFQNYGQSSPYGGGMMYPRTSAQPYFSNHQQQ